MKEMSGVVSDQKHECMASNVAMWLCGLTWHAMFQLVGNTTRNSTKTNRITNIIFLSVIYGDNYRLM